jgi:acyl dehydratase
VLVLDGPEELRAAVGTELGVSDWLEITQPEVDAFAELTRDHQWIHVDVERAKAGQFGSTIVHGFFTLSLVSCLQHAIYRIDGFEYGLNYGLDRVRFPAPVPVGGRVRLRVTLDVVQEVAGGLQAKLKNTFELEGGTKPVCVAEQLIRVYGVKES